MADRLRWPNLIIMFELAILGVSDGKILVGVENPPDASVAEFQQALSVSPDAQIETVQ